MQTPSVSHVSMHSSSSSMPRALRNVVTFRYQSKLAYVTVPSTHEEAQELAVNSFPRALHDVDPEWISFSIAVRYRSTGERKEIYIEPRSWYRVTSKLVPYRCIDIHVVIPPSQRGGSSTVSTAYSSLYPETPPQHSAPLYPASPSRPSMPMYHETKSEPEALSYPDSPVPQRRATSYPDSPDSQRHAPLYPDSPDPQRHAPLYPDSPDPQRHAPLYPDSPDPQRHAPLYPDSPVPQRHATIYPDTPPPSYPGPRREIHPFLAPTGYGYSFGWHYPQPTQAQTSSQGHFDPDMYDNRDTAPARNSYERHLYDSPREMADRRSLGWSESSVRMPSPERENAPIMHTPSSGAGLSLFSSIRERIFPIQSRGWTTRRRRRHPDYERDDSDFEGYTNNRGRSPYVPSLI